jgi:DNA-binding SARP family transcriptional activator
LDGVVCPELAAKAQALLFYLAVTRRPHLRAALAALLWADMPERDARSNLRKAIHQLQGKFGDYLSVDHHSVGLRTDARCSVDAVEFLNAAGGAGPSGAATNYLHAVELYGGEFLAGFYVRNAPEFEAWMLAEKDRLLGVMLRCLETLATHAAAQNDIQRAITFTRRIAEIEPWREDAQRRLMQLLAESGQRAAALKQYELCRQTLQEELGVEPAPATQALHDQLLRQEATGAALLRPRFITTTDFALVGRQAEWQTLRTIWRGLTGPHFVWIEGEAGIGKTRLAEDLLMLAEREELPVARSRTHALAGRLAYGPIADWLRTETLRVGLAELAAVWLTEVARLLPELLSERPGLPPPGPITDGWQNKRFFEALARAFTVKRGRLLLVLDDLQWCDAETLDWLHYLLDVADRPLLVVGTVRSEEVEDGHALNSLRHDLARQNKLTEIHLNFLTINETLALPARSLLMR